MGQDVPCMAQDEDIGARVRAARSYADLSQQGLADAIGVERRIVGYIEGNETRHELTVPEARRIAEACGVPVDFLLHGWGANGSSGALAERVAALETRVSSADEDREDLAARLDELDVALETRLEKFAEQVLMRRRTQRRRADPPVPADPPTP